MPLPLVNIVGNIVLPDGTDGENAIVTFKLLKADHDQNVAYSVLPAEVTVQLGAGGALDVDLWANANGATASRYRVTATWINSVSEQTVTGELGYIQPLATSPQDINVLLTDGAPAITEVVRTILTMDQYNAALAAVSDAQDAQAAAAGSASSASNSAASATTAKNEAAALVGAIEEFDLGPIAATISDASAVVASVIYSLSDMVDGGAAIRNAKHTSWYKAWGPMPEKVGVYATASSVTIRDLTKAGAPVWATISGGSYIGALVEASTYPITSIRWTDDGVLWVGQGGTYGGLAAFDFAKGRPRRYRALGSTNRSQGYSSRGIEEFAVVGQYDDTPLRIASENVNSVASFVYPDAPCDPETGLPIATVAVGHSAGVSVIKPNGTVANLTDTSGEHVSYTADGMLAVVKPNHVDIGPSPTSSMSFGSWVETRVSDPAWAADIRSLEVTGSKIAAGKYLGGPEGVTAIHRDALASTLMTTTWADTQFSGLVGSWLNSADDADLVGGELVTNGGFSNGLTGWASAFLGTGANGSITVSNGQLTLAAYDEATGEPYVQQGGFPAGAPVVVTVDYVSEANSYNLLRLCSASNVTLADFQSAGSHSATVTVPSDGILRLKMSGTRAAGSNAVLDNVSVRLADPDRSVSGKGLSVYGTVQKTEAVAGSGGLMAYSGFGASNYLQQPYNSAMDFAGNDWSVSFMVNIPTLQAATDWLFSRNGTHFAVFSNTSSFGLNFGGGNYASAQPLPAGRWVSVVFTRSGSTISKYVDGRFVESSSAGAAVLPASTAPLVVGNLSSDMTRGLAGSLACLQIYNRALSDDEISALYRLQRAALYGKTTLRSGDIKAIAADPYTGDLHVLTAWGLQVFDGKTLKEIEATAMSGKTKVAVHDGDYSLS